MSQARNPFSQAASQGYGDFTTASDDDDHEENNTNNEDELEGPQSPDPEEQETNEYGFTQTQERSYPTGDESPDKDENEEQNPTSDNEAQQEENDEEVGPSSPPAEEQDAEEEDTEHEAKEKQSTSQQRRRVKIMDDSDNEDESIHKEKNRQFLKQFTLKSDDSHKKHKKRRSDEHHHHHRRHESKSKRFRKASNDDEEHEDVDNNQEESQDKETDQPEATSDVEDVVDNIFGKDVDENEEIDDRDEAAAELADLADNEAVQEEEEEEEEEEHNQEQETFDNEEEDDEQRAARQARRAATKSTIDYDIDLFLEKRAERLRGNRSRSRKGNSEDLTDAKHRDDLVSALLEQMKIATEEDRIFNKSRQPATAKLLLLPVIEQHLCRTDLMESFIDHGLLDVFRDWLSPLPDKSLPNSKVREAIIKALPQFGEIDVDRLRDSGIGRALMYLYKHPRETKENKIKLIKIIHSWARPIFKLNTDFKYLTPQERAQRDVDQATIKRQTSLTKKPKSRSADVDLPFASDRRINDDDDANKDDDCPRARVPRPSNRDYVVRPTSSVELPEKQDGSKKRTASRLDELKRQQQNRQRISKPMSIVKLSIEGNKMHL